MYRILAVAVGQDNSSSFPNPIRTVNPTNVRPYILGLIDGLRFGYLANIGTDYDIWYRECPINTANAFNQGNDLIFPMSTRVTVNAINTGTNNPIVFPTGSNFKQDIPNNKLPKNVAGIDAHRDQGDKLLVFFKQAWPSLQTLYYLHFANYGPSERGKKGLQGAASSNHINLQEWDVTDGNLNLNGLPNGDGQTGLLVLPIDFCLGEGPQQAPNIIQVAQGPVAQGGKNLPTFFPIPDWASASVPTPAFGAYGISQYMCGRLASDLVYAILWQNDSPGTYGAVPAPPSLFDLVVNQTAADNLRIRLPASLQRHLSRGGQVNSPGHGRDRATGPHR